VASQISELFKIVREHRELLHVARISYDKPDKIREIVAQLNNQPEVNASSKEHRRSTVGSSINVNTIYASPSHVGVSSISTGSPIETLFQRV
jgi:hypothetical protein